MASIRFEIKQEDLERLTQAIMDYGEGAENVINQVLQGEASDVFKEAITRLIPVSNRNKLHAKYRNPVKADIQGNMSLLLHTPKPNGYLYFPDEGEGTSLHRGARDFMGKGVESKSDDVINAILEQLQSDLNL